MIRRLLLATVVTLYYLLVSATHLAAAPADLDTQGQAAPWAEPPTPTVLLSAVQNIQSALVPNSSPATGEVVLSIAPIGLRAPVIPVGVTTNNAIDVPAGNQIGRWIDSAQFGTPGTVFLDGHNTGVFSRLHSVTTGQIITIATDSQLYGYRVIRTETLSLQDVSMGSLLGSFSSKEEGLVLMTCAGDYIASQDTYDKRFVVYAARI